MKNTLLPNIDLQNSRDHFGAYNTKDLYKGKSFNMAGEGKVGTHYFNDESLQDFVSYNGTLLSCKTSHMSNDSNEPILIYDSSNTSVIGVQNTTNGNFILSGIKGERGAIADIKFVLPLTYSELVSLRENAQLKPGQQYRITDYVTTTSQINTQSAGHQFDVLVLATSESTLLEEAKAMLHEGDTYFAESDLNAGQIWYCLDNDTDRFKWADATNGKGVIYRMIDEFNNDCPYDFKNILFKHPNNTATYPDYYYTFSTVIDIFLIDHSTIPNYCYDNTIKEYISSNKQTLNNNVFLNTSETDYCYSNSFGNDCYSNSFGNECYNNSFGNSCYSNSFGDYCKNNSFLNGCKLNSFGNSCYDNSFEADCGYNSFGDSCSSNSFGNNCGGNSFGNDCSSNSFGNNCGGNSFGNDCSSNSFGNGCYSNSFGNVYGGNSFGNDCDNNSFRVSADASSTLKDYVQYNHFDDGCSKNVIWNSDTTRRNYLKNININRGVVGESRSYNYINIDVLNQDYEIQVAKNSNGEIKIYCEADLIA